MFSKAIVSLRIICLLQFNYIGTRLWHCFSLWRCRRVLNVSSRGQTQIPHSHCLRCTFQLFSVAVYHDPVRLQRITSFLDVEIEVMAPTNFGRAFSWGRWHTWSRPRFRTPTNVFPPRGAYRFHFCYCRRELGFLFHFQVVLLFMTLFFVVSQLKRATNLYQYLLVMGALLFITFQAIDIGL